MTPVNFHDRTEKYSKKIQLILEKRYSVDNLYTMELSIIYQTLFPEDTELFENYISLAHFKRQFKNVASKIGLDTNDFQEQANKNFQIPFIYGLVIGSYFLKMAHDKYQQKETSKQNDTKAVSLFLNNILADTVDQIDDNEIIDFNRVFYHTLQIGLFSKAFNISYFDMEISYEKKFDGLLNPNVIDEKYALFIEENIASIQNKHSATFIFKRNIMMIKTNFLEDVSQKFNSIVDKLLEQDTLNSLILISPDNPKYQDLVVNKDKRFSIENSRLQEDLKYRELSLIHPFPNIEYDIPDDTNSEIFNDLDFEEVGAQLSSNDKVVLSTLLKIKIDSYMSDKNEFPSQMVATFYKTILTDISKIDADFQYFCRKCLEIKDSYLYALETPPTPIKLINEAYRELATQDQSQTNNTLMLSPLNEKELKTLHTHFN